jgi:hypothetical protein
MGGIADSQVPQLGLDLGSRHLEVEQLGANLVLELGGLLAVRLDHFLHEAVKHCRNRERVVDEEGKRAARAKEGRKEGRGKAGER